MTKICCKYISFLHDSKSIISAVMYFCSWIFYFGSKLWKCNSTDVSSSSDFFACIITLAIIASLHSVLEFSEKTKSCRLIWSWYCWVKEFLIAYHDFVFLVLYFLSLTQKSNPIDFLVESDHLIFLWNWASKYWLLFQFNIYFHTCIKTLCWWY